MELSLSEIEHSIENLPRRELLQFRSWYEKFDDEFAKSIEKKWVQESEKRFDAYLKGEVEAIPLNEIRKKYGE